MIALATANGALEVLTADPLNPYPMDEIGILFDLVVEEQLEGIIEFLERFTAAPPPDQPRSS